MKKLIIFLSFAITCYAGSPQGVGVESTVTCGTASGLLIAANSNRGAWEIQNQGSDTTGHCHLKIGSAISGTEGFWVDSGQNWDSNVLYVKQAVYCKCDSAAQTMEVLQSNW